jgi:hypothetical protein
MNEIEKELFQKFQEIAKTDPVAQSALSQFMAGYGTLQEMFLQVLLIFYEQKQRSIAMIEGYIEKYATPEPIKKDHETANCI